MNVQEIPALGRPFELGMLYDCRTHNLKTNPKLWDKKTVALHTVNQPQTQCDFEFTADDTFSAKTSFLNVKADLKLSLLFGLVKVHGSAEYLNNHRETSRQARVSLKYSCRTHFRELQTKDIMSELQLYRGELNSITATHVVTGILYGIDAILVFDRNSTDEEDHFEIHKQLETMIRFFPTISIPGGRNTDERKNKILDRVNCTYHSDMILGSKPASFEDAILLFKNLPSKIEQNGDMSVPMSVWLYPLNRLIDKTLTLDLTVDESLVNQILDRFEKFQILKLKCIDLLKSPTCEYDETYQQKVAEILNIVQQSKTVLRKALSRNVTSSATNALVDNNVVNILDKLDKSATCSDKLENYISEIRKIINVLDSCVRKIKRANEGMYGNALEDHDHRDRPFTLPRIKNLFENIQDDSHPTAVYSNQIQRSDILSMIEKMKKDYDVFLSQID